MKFIIQSCWNIILPIFEVGQLFCKNKIGKGKRIGSVCVMVLLSSKKQNIALDTVLCTAYAFYVT